MTLTLPRRSRALTAVALSLSLLATGACMPDIGNFDLSFPPDAFDGIGCGLSIGLTGECLTAENPFAILTVVDALATDSTLPLDIIKHSSLPGFVLESDNPAVVAVENPGGHTGTPTLVAGEPGTAVIRAFNEDGSWLLDELFIEVAEPAALSLTWEATRDGVADGGVGLVGGAERVHVVMESADGLQLQGIRPDLNTTVDGALIEVPVAETEARLSRNFRFGSASRPTTHVLGVGFLQPGTGTVQVTTADGLSATITLEAVDSVATMAIEMDADDPLIADEIPMAMLIAETADGRRIGGVRGWWSTSVRGGPLGNLKAEEVAILAGDEQAASEVALVPLRDGELFIYCEVGDTVLELHTALTR